MMKKHALLGLAALISVLTSCGGNTASESRLHVIFDNPAPRTMPVSLFGEVPDELVSSLGIADGIPSSVSVMLLEKDGQQLLFDAGNGNDDSRLLPRLQELGYTSADIDAIFITHLHGDHIGGLLKDGEAVFSEAKLYINNQELQAWKAMPEERNAQVRQMIQAYGERLIAFDVKEALPCEIQPIAAYGHTEGHTVYRIGDKLIAGDIMHGIALQLEHPEYCARYDMDKEAAIASRKSVLERVKQEGWTLFGMHFPTADGVKVK